MGKLVYEVPDGVETREFERDELTLNTETGCIIFQIGETNTEKPVQKIIPLQRVYHIENENDIEVSTEIQGI
jgi:hypothetical protein